MSTFKVQNPVVHLPSISLHQLTREVLETLLVKNWEWHKLKLTDNLYFVPPWEDWDKIFQYEMKSLPKYVPEKFDCEQFGGWLRIMVAKDFGVNVCGDAEGYVDFQDGKGKQRHGWTVFTEGEGLYQVESQMATGYHIMDIDNPFYIPDELVMG